MSSEHHFWLFHMLMIELHETASGIMSFAWGFDFHALLTSIPVISGYFCISESPLCLNELLETTLNISAVNGD